MDNICKFVPTTTVPDVIHTINFVYEADIKKTEESCLCSVYKICLVMGGSAEVTSEGCRRTVGAGDIFFIFPSVPYLIDGNGEFSYMYISYIGIRAGALMDRLEITPVNFVFSGFENLASLWREAISLNSDFSDMSSEGVLLYTLSRIGEKTRKNRETKSGGASESFLLIKKYIDDNFSDSTLSLAKIGKEFSYSQKYISYAFKKHFKIGVTEYLNTIRINHACALIARNYTGVRDIAYLCGFDDPLYFSKVFKQRMKLSPKEYIKAGKF